MGWDPHYGFQLYQSDPSGNYGGWKATCIGNNHQAAISLLKQEYKDKPSLDEALELSIKILHKTLDSTKLNADKGKISVKVYIGHIYTKSDSTEKKILNKCQPFFLF